MNFELFDTAFERGEGLVRNSKFKIENSKFSRRRQAMLMSAPEKANTIRISSEEN